MPSRPSVSVATTSCGPVFALLARGWPAPVQGGRNLGHSRFGQDIGRRPIEYLRADGSQASVCSIGGTGEFEESTLEAGAYGLLVPYWWRSWDCAGIATESFPGKR